MAVRHTPGLHLLGHARRIVVGLPELFLCLAVDERRNPFGGRDLNILYITTASMRMSDDELAADPLAGSLFAVDTGVRGLPEPRFGG